MERNSRNSQGYRLESQIREAYGKVVYTQTCHNKIMDRKLCCNDYLKISQIILSAITSSGILVYLFNQNWCANAIGAVASVILLALNTYSKNFNPVEVAQEHKVAADLLWKIREEYVSLLTDFEILSVEQIIEKRDELQERCSTIYSQYPGTDKKSYRKAQKALKVEQEQSFSESEIDVMLPDAVRRRNRNIRD